MFAATISRLKQRCEPSVRSLDVAECHCRCTGRQISACLERARAELNRRSVELEDMMLEWRQFDETMAEFERWVSVVEDDCQSHASHAADAYTINDVTQLIAINHVSHFLVFSVIVICRCS